MELKGQISVVIPAWNEAAWLRPTVEAVRNMPEVKEVIVADNSSVDETVAIARELDAVVVVGGTPAAARNRGAARAEADFILFLDADILMPEGTLRAALKAFEEDSEMSACVFRVEVVDMDRYARFGYSIADIFFRILARLHVVQGLGNAILVRKSFFGKIGGFDDRVKVGEDVDLLRRMRLAFPASTRYFATLPVGTSSRRFKIENKAVFSLKVIVWTAVRLSGARWSPIAYAWKTYPRKLAVSYARRSARYLASKERSGGQGSAR